MPAFNLDQSFLSFVCFKNGILLCETFPITLVFLALPVSNTHLACSALGQSDGCRTLGLLVNFGLLVSCLYNLM